MSAEQADVVFVQPHFDDVALSCGATAAACAAVGRPLIVTVFAGRPGAALGKFAKFQHDRWGLTDLEVITRRREEDRCAAAALGSTVGVRWLDFLDAIYRSDEYSSDSELFGEPLASDDCLVEEIAASLADMGDRFVLPLGIGNHVDHQLVYQAGVHLRDSGNVVRYYADLPYALDQGAYDERLAALGNARPTIRAVAMDDFERRWSAIQCYASQLAVLFRHIDNPRERFEQFGRRLADRQPVELFWNLDGVEGQKA